MTGKQRARLRAIASTEDTIFQLGKDNLTDNFIKSVGEALDAREIVKFKVLRNSVSDVKSVAYEIAEALGADVVTVIGNKAVLYRATEKNILGL